MPEPAEQTAQRCRSVLGRLYSQRSTRAQMAPTNVPAQSASQVQYREKGKKNTNIEHTARQPVTAGTVRALQHCDHHRATCILSAGRTVGEVRLQPRLRQRLLRLSKRATVRPPKKRSVPASCATYVHAWLGPSAHSIWKARCATRVVISRGTSKRTRPEAVGGGTAELRLRCVCDRDTSPPPPAQTHGYTQARKDPDSKTEHQVEGSVQ